MLELEGDSWTETGIVRGRVLRITEGTREFDVEKRQVHKVVPYEWSDATFLRAIVAPLYFGLLGPLWADSIPDYGGDGTVGPWDRTRFSLAMLNIFEAFPNSRATERLERVVGRTRERRPDKVELVSAPGEVTLKLTHGQHEESLTEALREGTFAIDMRPVLPRFFGHDMKAVLSASDGAQLTIRGFGRQNVASLMLRYGPYSRDLRSIEAAELAFAKELLLFAARSHQTPKRRAVELYQRLHELERRGMPEPTLAEGATRKILDASQAARDGMIELSAKGVDLYRIAVSVKNMTDAPLHVRVPPGLLFDCAGSAQDMLTTQAVEIHVSANGRSAHHRVAAACANMSKPTPASRDSFGLGEVSDPRLAVIAPQLQRLSRQVRQAVVWIITDDATISRFQRYSTPRIRRSEVLQAIAVFERAGVSIEDRAIWKWYTDGK